MAEISTIRLNVALRELNISLDRAVEFWNSKILKLKAVRLPRFPKTFIKYFWMSLRQINPKKMLLTRSVRRKRRKRSP
jgi:hypothetical protein